ncbi:MAG: DUF1311 domain-containing protein [Acidobacteriota bacterium]|nr:DUF1311 domain-containing protein [Acidobacteriota bacterium]
MTKAGFIAVFFLAAGSIGAHAASFNCQKANTKQEKAICASTALSAADDQMDAAYRKLLRSIPPQAATAIREEQRAWLRFRRLNCTQYEEQGEKKLSDCLEGVYRERNDDLEHGLSTQAGIRFLSHALYLTVPDGDEADAHIREVEEIPGYGTLEAEWLEALSDSAEWKAWNAAIEGAAQEMARGTIVGKGGNSTKWAALPAEDDEISVGLEKVGPDLVTATITGLYDGHGAHPNHGSIEFNWLIREKRELKPLDVFLAGSDWVEALRAACDRDLHKKLDQEGESYDQWIPNMDMQASIRKIVGDSENWRIDEKGISIVWQPYAVACYACTPEPTLIPWSSLKGIMNSSFAIPAGTKSTEH